MRMRGTNRTGTAAGPCKAATQRRGSAVRLTHPAIAAILLGAVLLGRLAAAADAVPFAPTLTTKTRCTVAIDRLHPTQCCVGYWEVDRRAENIAGKSPRKLRDYLEEHLALIVIGPGGEPYLIDGHHLCRALLKSKVADTVDARVEANWRNLTPEQFWPLMKEHGWVYLYDAKGRGPLDPTKLPKKVTDLTDDPYRSLAWAVRDRGGFDKTTASFAEFQWANFFRTRITIGSGPGAFERAVGAALKISHSPEAKNLPGYVPEHSERRQGSAEKGDWLRGAGCFGSGRNVAATVPVPLVPPIHSPPPERNAIHEELENISRRCGCPCDCRGSLPGR